MQDIAIKNCAGAYKAQVYIELFVIFFTKALVARMKSDAIKNDEPIIRVIDDLLLKFFV